MTGADIYMKTCKEKALEWNVSLRSVNDMCKKGRIQGAIKEKGSWLIPDDSPKPMDGLVFVMLPICQTVSAKPVWVLPFP